MSSTELPNCGVCVHDGPGLTPGVLGMEQIQVCFFSIESIFLLREHGQTPVRVA